MQLVRLTIGTLAVWRLTHLLQSESGPSDMFVRLRQAVGRGPLADLFACFYCLSLWVSAPVALLMASGLKETIVAWPALSAGAILINRVAERYG